MVGLATVREVSMVSRRGERVVGVSGRGRAAPGPVADLESWRTDLCASEHENFSQEDFEGI
jgi:hypothetical protein